MSFQVPDRIRTMGQPSKFGSVSYFNDERLEILGGRLASNTLDSRQKSRWTQILAHDNTSTPLGPLDPFNVPLAYENPTGHEMAKSIITTDGLNAVDFGLRWRVLANSADAEAAVRILRAWSNIGTLVNANDSRLVWSYCWPLFIQAANLVSNSSHYTAQVKSEFEAQTRRGLELSSAHVQTENRAMWGCMMEVSAGSFLRDRKIFDRAIYRYRELFSIDVVDNIPVGEIDRGSNGLYYCNFLLNAMTQTAEIARFNGEWLYDVRAPDGSTMKGLWETVSGWTANPSTYQYWPGSSTVRIQGHTDILHALWPNANSTNLINNYSYTQDFYGHRNTLLAHRNLPLYG